MSTDEAWSPGWSGSAPGGVPSAGAMRVVGLISGTSHDAIEAVAVDLLLAGDVLEAELLQTRSIPYDPALRERLIAALPPARTTLEEVCILDTAIGQAFAEVAAEVSESLSGRGADLVCSHGQTVFHWVSGQRALGTLQIGQPAWIAERLGVPVVADVRARDVAAGGHGAPLASILDALLLGDSPEPCAALNLGGIANITVLNPGHEPIAYDTGPANALIDAAVNAQTGGREKFDCDGERSARGTVDEALLAHLLEEPYYALPWPKSTGKELYHATYLKENVAGRDIAPDDLLATLAALSVETIAREVERFGVQRLVAAGGGTRNRAIMNGLRARLPGVEIQTYADLGVPDSAKEALVFAIIGFLTACGIGGALPSCTGASRRAILGSITPGRERLRLPDADVCTPVRLVLR